MQYVKFLIIVLLLSFSRTLLAHPFLWQVTGEHNFYLFGTIHLPDPRVTVLPPEVDKALSESTSFYAELDLTESNTMLITQSMWLSGNKTLHDLLSAELKENITQYLKSINPDLNLEYFAKQKIWVLAVTLTVLEQQLKFPGHLPLDSSLYQKASLLGLQTGGLETVQEQLGIFDELSEEQQIQFLTDTVEFLTKNHSESDDFIESSLQAYLNGELNELMIHLMSYMKNDNFYIELLDKLINKRNVQMTDTILSLVMKNPDEKYFFAVGVGHFWGENSINQLLTKQGYTIQVID